MPYTIVVDAVQGIIETRYIGMLSPGELVKAAQETLAKANMSGNFRPLGDCTELRGGHSIGDLYGLAEQIGASPYASRIREAVLLPEVPGPADDVRFWETACLNRGLQVKRFDDRALAFAWLLA